MLVPADFNSSLAYSNRLRKKKKKISGYTPISPRETISSLEMGNKMETSQQNNFKLDFQKSIAHKLSEEEKEKKKKDKFKLKNNTLSKKKTAQSVPTI